MRVLGRERGGRPLRSTRCPPLPPGSITPLDVCGADMAAEEDEALLTLLPITYPAALDVRGLSGFEGTSEDPGREMQSYLDAGGDPNARVRIPRNEHTPTLLALGCCDAAANCARLPVKKREPAIAVLLAAGADPNVGFVAAGKQHLPLFSAAFYGEHGIAAWLLAHGAAVDATVEGKTALVGVAGSPHVDDTTCRDIVRLLLSYRANPQRDFRCRWGDPPLEKWCQYQPVRRLTHALLRDVRLCGGWKGYVREPRKRLLVLRELCLRGRAAPPAADGAAAGAALLARLFVAAPTRPGRTRMDAAGEQQAKKHRKRARTAPPASPPQHVLFGSACEDEEDGFVGDDLADETSCGAEGDDRRLLGELPAPVFWRVMKYWRSERDYVPPKPPAPARKKRPNIRDMLARVRQVRRPARDGGLPLLQARPQPGLLALSQRPDGDESSPGDSAPDAAA